MVNNNKVYPHIALIAMTLIYSYNYHISSFILKELTGHELTLLRIVFAAITFSIIDYLRIIRLKLKKTTYKNKSFSNKDGLWIILASILMPIFSQLLFFEGLKLTEPVNASIMRLGTPIVVVLIGSLLHFKNLSLENINFIKIIGVLLAVFGGYRTILNNTNNISITYLFQNSGDFLVFLSAAAFGAYTLIIKHLIEKKHHFITLLRWSFTLGALLLFLAIPFGIYEYPNVTTGKLIEISVNTNFWFQLFYLLFFATLLTFIFNISALKHLSPTLVGTYTCLQPVGTAIIGFILGQQISSSILITGLLIVVSVIMVSNSEIISQKIKEFVIRIKTSKHQNIKTSKSTRNKKTVKKTTELKP